MAKIYTTTNQINLKDLTSTTEAELLKVIKLAAQQTQPVTFEVPELHARFIPLPSGNWVWDDDERRVKLSSEKLAKKLLKHAEDVYIEERLGKREAAPTPTKLFGKTEVNVNNSPVDPAVLKAGAALLGMAFKAFANRTTESSRVLGGKNLYW